MSDVRSHRAPGGLAAFGARLGIGALVIAAIAVGGVVNSFAPDSEHRERPFIRTGAQGQTVNARTFDVEVRGVRGATRISRSGKVRESKGVWVLVTVRVMAHREPTVIGYAALRDGRDRVFVSTDRITQPLVGGRTLQPGLAVEAEIAFEVPTDVTDLSIRLSSRMLDQRMDAMAEIPLDIDQAAIQRWLPQNDKAPPPAPLVIANEKVVQWSRS